jgi:hypothetical protein
MKKFPLYFYLILWIISLAFAQNDLLKIKILSELFALIVFIMPSAFAYLWFLKNRIKIFKYYKKIRIRFRHIFYTIESLVCLTIIGLIISVITVGGFKNFSERVKFEYLVYNDQKDSCSNASGWSRGYGKYDEFFWKAHTQFIDYFQYKPYKVVKNVVSLKQKSLFSFNHCKAIRHLLRAAHKGHKVSKDILATIPQDIYFYVYSDEYLFQRYVDSLDEKKLYNAALVHSFANKKDSKDYLLSVERRRELYKEAAEEGHLLAMQDYLSSFDKGISDKSACPIILKYSNDLVVQNSLMESIYFVFASMGRIGTFKSKIIYECNDKKIDFAKAIIHLKDFYTKTGFQLDTSNTVTTYPALIYFNGWGNVQKNQELAIELFLKNIEDKNPSRISKAYLFLNELNNYQDGLELLNEIIDSEVTTYKATRFIYCNNIKYDFKIPKVDKETKQEKQSRITKYLEPLKSCLNSASREEGIKSVQSYIKSWIDNWFKNPELVKNLNLYG